MRKRRRIFFSIGVLACIAIAASCREPTQITLRITTGEKCSDLTGVQIVVGSDAESTQKRFKERFSAAVTHACSPEGTTNLIGTLVVTPGTSTGTVVISAGVKAPGVPDADPADCFDEKFAKQCIIARRSFSFIDHTSLNLPIDLDPLCVGKTCDPASTCFKGACVNDTVACQGSDCGLPQETGNGSGGDASSSDGTYDADMGTMTTDASGDPDDAGDSGSQIVDANPDAATGSYDGPVPLCGSAGVVYCVPNGTNGVGDGKKCDGQVMAGIQCCYCVCADAGTGKVVSCDAYQSMGNSCHPVCQ